MKRGSSRFLNPVAVLNQLNIEPDMRIADFGCGHGYFSLPLARVLPEGTVYALDVLEEALQAVRSKAELEGIKNIETIRGNLETDKGSKLDDLSVDFVFLVNILFQTQKKSEIIREAKRVLKQDGKIIIVDWIDSAPMAPRQGWLLTEDEAKALVEAEGILFDKNLAMDDQHYGLVFRK